MTATQHERKWWKEAVVYQIYPASFKDSNGDGIGDIPGIISKLDYVRDLGVDVIWLSPHYKSPQVDMGYDISDFEDVHAPYGALADCQQLIDETHARGMKIIFDLVINHTSDQHPWFEESRSSTTNPKRDWYFWRPPRYDADGHHHAPNNWRSHFTLPAWDYDEHTGEYYLHLYAKEMPDLNWENEECRRAIYETSMKFWLDRGIDGFRIDTVNKYSKDVSFPDAAVTDPHELTQPATEHYSNGPRMREFLLEMNDVFEQYDVFTVGELPSTPAEADVLAYVSAQARQLNMVFNFDTVGLGQTEGDRLKTIPFTHADVRRELSRWQTFVHGTDAWTTVFLENHDQGRSISRFASDAPADRERGGKMLACILATMTGTLFLYQGQEIGMVNAPPDWGPDEYKDVRSVNYYGRVREKSHGDPATLTQALAGMRKVARDHSRLPMHWDATAHAGFTSCADNDDDAAKPWMRVHDNYRDVNVKRQADDPTSLLSFWKRLIQLRRQYKDLFVYGRYELCNTNDDDDDDLFVFVKSHAHTTALTVANMSDRPRPWRPGPQYAGGLVIGNVDGDDGGESDDQEDSLRPWEARIYIHT